MIKRGAVPGSRSAMTPDPLRQGYPGRLGDDEYAGSPGRVSDPAPGACSSRVAARRSGGQLSDEDEIDQAEGHRRS